MMTESEAKQRWCPHVRHAVSLSREHPAGATANRDSGEHYGCGDNRCIASECMAWRTEPPPRETMRNYHDAPTVKRERWSDGGNYGGGWQYSHTDIDRDGRKFDLLHRLPSDEAPRLGYCGLSGKPGETA